MPNGLAPWRGRPMVFGSSVVSDLRSRTANASGLGFGAVLLPTALILIFLAQGDQETATGAAAMGLGCLPVAIRFLNPPRWRDANRLNFGFAHLVWPMRVPDDVVFETVGYRFGAMDGYVCRIRFPAETGLRRRRIPSTIGVRPTETEAARLAIQAARPCPTVE